MIIHRDNSPERNREYEQMLARSMSVESCALKAETALYHEFERFWGQPTINVPPIPGAASLIDHAFLKANIEAESSRLASDRAITNAQQRVAEVFDDFPA